MLAVLAVLAVAELAVSVGVAAVEGVELDAGSDFLPKPWAANAAVATRMSAANLVLRVIPCLLRGLDRCRARLAGDAAGPKSAPRGALDSNFLVSCADVRRRRLRI